MQPASQHRRRAAAEAEAEAEAEAASHQWQQPAPTMDAMCDVTRATSAQKAAAKPWTVWESATHEMDAESRFDFDYGTNFQERVVVLSGRATLTPQDGCARAAALLHRTVRAGVMVYALGQADVGGCCWFWWLLRA
eukprot:COSAG01_NODE_25052_length_757_cov_0.946809_1_plen_136_part_00